MDDPVPLGALVRWLHRFADLVAERCEYLTELDSAIGDADHGTNLDRGMTAVVEKVTADPPATAESLLTTAGMALVASVGGASGPLYGTLLLRMATAAGPVDALDAAALAAALRAGLDGVTARGKAQPGDKTMVDALAPAVSAFEEAAGSGAAAAAWAAATAADRGRDATTAMLARKGRASYLGERSVGHLDPGAASSALLVRALAETLAGTRAEGSGAQAPSGAPDGEG